MTYKGVLLHPVQLPSESAQALAYEIISKWNAWNVTYDDEGEVGDVQKLSKVIDDFYNNLKRF